MLAELAPGTGQVLLDQVEREGIVAGGHRRVGGEDGRLAHLFERVVEARAVLDELADALQHDERRVPFVEVPDGRLDAHRPQHAHAADAEDDLLLDAGFAVAAVEPGRQLAVPRRVLVEVGVEQVELHVADADPPDRRQHRAIAERHRGDARLAVGGDGGFDRGVGPVDALVVFLLPAVVGDALVEVSLRVHEADADQRQAQVAGLLAVVAGQHAEAAGVDRQRLVQRELGREVGNRPRVARPPAHRATTSVADLRVASRPAIDRVVQLQEDRVVGGLLQDVGAEHPQHPRRVVRRGPPHRQVEAAEQGTRFGMPAPPHVGGEFAEAVDAAGKRGGEAFHET